MITFKNLQLVKDILPNWLSTRCLISKNDETIFKKLIAIDLSKQQILDVDPKSNATDSFYRKSR